MSSVKNLVQNLSMRGISPLKVVQGNSMSPPSVWITESIYIQVHNGDVVICRDRPNDLSMYPTSSKIDDILITLKKAIKDGRPS